MKRLISIIVVFYLLLSNSFAQNEEDVLRYSNTQLIGSARYLALGGAYGAVGADFSSLSSNPAGIGLYKRSEFSITPMLYFGSAESRYGGQTHDGNKNNFALGNAGFVLNFQTADRLDSSPFKNFQMGFGVNRLKDFNNSIFIQGVNSDNSLLDAYLSYAGNKNPESLNPFDTRLAFDTFLLDTIPGAAVPTYVNAYSYIGGFSSALQRKSIETYGSVNEWVLSGGTNINDKLYLGFTVGFPQIRYFQSSVYNEVNQTTPLKDLDQFNYIEDLETNGGGVNVKVGAIVRPLDWLRVGAAYHSPTWYTNLDDSWSTRMNAYYTNGDFFTSNSPVGDYNYDIQTPSKFIGSLALLFGNMGLISADYEYVDFSKGKLDPSFDFSMQNEIIRDNFTAGNNLRIGTEWRAGVMLLRGGYANYGSPFRTGVNDGQIQTFSAGLGYRNRDYFIDAAFNYSVSEMDYTLYGNNVVSPVPSALNKYQVYNFLITLGYRFD
ncbi:MAG: outer membrane protein transport protein [Bacteroidales bacterium]|nr:outer membrane protein transport protein [Bacteroidales bacterium]